MLFFLRDHHNYFLVRPQLTINGKSISQYALYSLIFSPLHSIKGISTITGHYGKYRILDCQSKCPCYCGYVALTWYICFSSSKVWLTFQANNLISAPASAALSEVSHQSHNTCTANRHLRGSVERNGVQRRTKISFGRTMMQALELLHLVKRHVSGQIDDEQCKNQSIAIIIA